MINALICGANGKLGQEVAACALKNENIEIVAGVDKYHGIQNSFPVYDEINEVQEKVDVIIDFSRPDCLEPCLKYSEMTGACLVIATTGYTAQHKELIHKYSQNVPIFFAANMSLGVNLQMELSKNAAEFLGNDFDIEIIEKHHNLKVDAPSGTALAIAENINNVFLGSKEFKYGRTPSDGRREGKEMGIHAVRGGTVVGEHEVGFYGNDEIITITHRALSKQIFAMGALRAAEFLVDKPAGLYCMADIIAESKTVTSMTTDNKQSIVSIGNIPFHSDCLAHIFEELAKNNINIDIISQTMPFNDVINVSFSVPKKEVSTAQNIILAASEKYGNITCNHYEDLTKITLEGMGMERQSGVASKLFSCLAKCNVQIITITTSETKILLCIKTEDSAKALTAISETFKL